MKRNGYTIAEALITMAIIGVVAALTLPTFISKYRKQVYASSLSSAVANFENAMTNMIIKDGVDDLLDTRAWSSVESAGSYSLTNGTNEATIKRFMGYTAAFMPMAGYETAGVSYKNLSNSGNVAIGNPVRFKTKGGVEYLLEASNVSKTHAKLEADVLSSGTNYMNKAADVYIDINGSSSPNIMGRDCFGYELGTDGRLYPYGSRDWTVYNNQTYTSPKTKCATQRDGDYCAAYLMENGYKMDY